MEMRCIKSLPIKVLRLKLSLLMSVSGLVEAQKNASRAFPVSHLKQITAAILVPGAGKTLRAYLRSQCIVGRDPIRPLINECYERRAGMQTMNVLGNWCRTIAPSDRPLGDSGLEDREHCQAEDPCAWPQAPIRGFGQLARPCRSRGT